MAEVTNIEWADSTFNPWMGCTKVGPGCDHCYAENLMDTRWGKVVWGPGAQRVRTKASTWNAARKWNANADAFQAKHGRRQRVFCASLADVFDNEVDPQWRADLFALILATPALDWMLLTKRIGNVVAMIGTFWGKSWPENLWIGATIVNQEEADRDIPKLLRVPARVRFLSMEPLLGPVDLGAHLLTCCGNLQVGAEYMGQQEQVCCGNPEPRDALQWVIVGGESGPGARPMHPDWARSLRDQCEEAGVPYLFKQWGEWYPTEQDFNPPIVLKNGESLTLTMCGTMARIGKKAAGRLLDGRTHDGYPS